MKFTARGGLKCYYCGKTLPHWISVKVDRLIGVSDRIKMVIGDRNGEEGRNGRRSRGSSPNGHLSDDSSASDDSDHG